MSKFADFLSKNKIDQRRLLSASKSLEGLRPEDRSLKLAKKSGKKAEGEKAEGTTQKPRSGRPVSLPTLNAAIAGKPLTGTTKTRLLRALNHVLTQKKKDAVSVRELW